MKVTSLVEGISVGAGVGDVGGDGVPGVDQGPELVFGDDPGVGESQNCAAHGEVFEDFEGGGYDICDSSACSAASQEPVDVLILGGCSCETGAIGQYALDFQQLISC